MAHIDKNKTIVNLSTRIFVWQVYVKWYSDRLYISSMAVKEFFIYISICRLYIIINVNSNSMFAICLFTNWSMFGEWKRSWCLFDIVHVIIEMWRKTLLFWRDCSVFFLCVFIDKLSASQKVCSINFNRQFEFWNSRTPIRSLIA